MSDGGRNFLTTFRLDLPLRVFCQDNALARYMCGDQNGGGGESEATVVRAQARASNDTVEALPVSGRELERPGAHFASLGVHNSWAPTGQAGCDHQGHESLHLSHLSRLV